MYIYKRGGGPIRFLLEAVRLDDNTKLSGVFHTAHGAGSASASVRWFCEPSSSKGGPRPNAFQLPPRHWMRPPSSPKGGSCHMPVNRILGTVSC